jgi:hypothetical protein
MTNLSQRSSGPTSAVVLLCLAWVVVPTVAHSYAAWADGCDNCHGDFNSGTYVSQTDAVSWGTDLMSGHLDFLGNQACSVCHQPPNGTPRSPVYIGISAGITGFSPVACLGCHGRAEDAKGAGACVAGSATTINTANCGSGAGLRKHHASAGETVCAICHTNDGTVLGESFQPAYYFTPDAAHLSKPIDACNAAAVPGNENKFGLAGLDNDGDLLYDSADPDCGDTDSDGIRNGSDNCTLLSNASQADSDGDGYGNRCDADLNNNGATNAQDTSMFRPRLGTTTVPPVYDKADFNANGVVNAQDTSIFRTLLGSPPGPSGLACAGTVPCPVP